MVTPNAPATVPEPETALGTPENLARILEDNDTESLSRCGGIARQQTLLHN